MRKRALLSRARAARKRGDEADALAYEKQALAVKRGGRKRGARNRKLKDPDALVADALFLMEHGADAFNKPRKVAREVSALDVMSKEPSRRPNKTRDTEEEINSLARRISRARARRRAVPNLT